MLLSLVFFGVVFAALGLGIILLVYPFETVSQYLLGLLLGCFVTAIRILLMDRAIDKTVDLPEKQAKNKYQLLFFLRYGILIVFAAILIIFNQVFGIWGGVVGIICMQFSAYGANYLLTKYEKKTGKKLKRNKPKKMQQQHFILEIEEKIVPENKDSKKAFDVMEEPVIERTIREEK